MLFQRNRHNKARKALLTGISCRPAAKFSSTPPPSPPPLRPAPPRRRGPPLPRRWIPARTCISCRPSAPTAPQDTLSGPPPARSHRSMTTAALSVSAETTGESRLLDADARGHSSWRDASAFLARSLGRRGPSSDPCFARATFSRGREKRRRYSRVPAAVSCYPHHSRLPHTPQFEASVKDS